MMHKIVFVFWIFSTNFLSSVAQSDLAESCITHPEVQISKSKELKKIVKADQMDRSVPIESIDWEKLAKKDLQRRAQVAKIFAEGCLKEASDYAAAALVFQHGESIDHFFQAFIWSNRAIQLGDDSLRSLAAGSLDRYLVKLGHKQLFGTQFFKNSSDEWCIESVESAFPAERRYEFLKMNLEEYKKILLSFYKSKQTASEVLFCEHNLMPTPTGTIPGFW